MQLWCLHGNLQMPAVWAPLAAYFADGRVEVKSVDLWETLAPGCWEWAQQFCRELSQMPPARRYLLGYSMGGRLALHAVLYRPELWAGAIIVAADPGVSDLAERVACLRRDRIWGQRFLTEPWAQVLADWDAQGIFGGRPNPVPRDCGQLRRALICQAFYAYSKGRQADLRPALTRLPQPSILYVTGAADSKYTAIGAQLAVACSTVRHAAISSAGHRVPWETPTAFYQQVEKFIQS